MNDLHASQKRRKKDPAAPKAPLNGYLVYFNDERADMRMKNPNMGFGELTKIIALKWKDLPAEEKQRFITEADLDKERYVKEMAEYKKSESYRQYVKESSQAKQARNEEAIVNSMHTDPMGLMNSTPNNFSIVNETNVAGFDIPGSFLGGLVLENLTKLKNWKYLVFDLNSMIWGLLRLN